MAALICLKFGKDLTEQLRLRLRLSESDYLTSFGDIVWRFDGTVSDSAPDKRENTTLQSLKSLLIR